MAIININGGMFGEFTYSAKEREDGEEGLTHSPILRNGEFYLPWHVNAAIFRMAEMRGLPSYRETAEGWEEIPPSNKPLTKGEVVQLLLHLRKVYTTAPWRRFLATVNALTGATVY